MTTVKISDLPVTPSMTDASLVPILQNGVNKIITGANLKNYLEPGPRGYSGSQGIQGVPGNIGYTGSQGVIGYTGSRGVVGFTGSKGEIGFTGPAGNEGPIGYTGSHGTNGYTGSAGTNGYTGSAGVGYTGSRGDTGFTGSQGDLGYTGSRGSDGTSVRILGSVADSSALNAYNTSGLSIGDGLIQLDNGHLNVWDGTSWADVGGIVGPIGYTGSLGDTGFTGSSGDTGFTGSSGDVGYTGSQGDVGFTGSSGDTGFTGSAGNVGFTGSSGDVGYTGSSGDTGFTGSSGDVGYTGSLGETGPIGYTGSSGQNGDKLTSGNVELVLNSNGSVQFNSVLFPADDGSNGQVLSTDGTGNLTWIDVGLAGAVDIIYDAGDVDDNQERGLDGGDLGSEVEYTAEDLVDMGIADGNYGDALATVALTADYGDLINRPMLANVALTGSYNDLTDKPLLTNGYTGSVGVTGYTGSAGNTGTTGYTGSTGTTGYTGSQGEQGIQGIVGYTGSAGTNGYTGSAGTNGYTGSQGEQGIQGIVGYTGSAGTNGYSGSAGTNGYTGSAGVGYTGSAGTNGYTGSAGPIAGSDTQIIFNDSNVAGASSNLTFNKATNLLTVTGNAVVAGTSGTGINAIQVGVSNTLLPNTIVSFSSTVNNYTQVTLQNKSSGADATADYIITADNGSDTTNYVDFGIINSGYDVNTPTNSLGNIVYAADGYLYAQGTSSGTTGGNLVIGTTTSGKTVKIFAGGTTSNSLIANISSTGVAVTGALSVSGNITGNTNGFAIGYRDIPQVTFNANATITTSDAGKHYYSTSSSNLTLTVANNASQAFSIGAAINIINLGTGNITVAQGAGVTLYFAGNSTAGNRTISSYGAGTIQKVATDTWFLVGVGVT